MITSPLSRELERIYADLDEAESGRPSGMAEDTFAAIRACAEAGHSPKAIVRWVLMRLRGARLLEE